MDLQDQTVVITGASNGIGRQLAIDLAARGAVIVGCGRSAQGLSATLEQVRHHSSSSMMIACDVGNHEQVRCMVSGVLERFSKIDILINNAGIGMRQPFADTALSTVEEIMRTNYIGTVYCTYEVLPSMIARKSGRIINVSSIAGHMGTLNMAAYCASKFAVNGWSESLYHELRPLGISVSLISPGPVKTEFNRAFATSTPQSPSFLTVDTAAVSRAVIKIIDSKRFEIIMPPVLALLCFFKRLMPNVFRALCYRAFRRYVTVPQS
jgi:short-subunit dehydrogenase